MTDARSGRKAERISGTEHGGVQHQEIGVGKRTLIDATFAPRVQLTGRSLQLQTLQPHRVPSDEQVHTAAAAGLEGPDGSLLHLAKSAGSTSGPSPSHDVELPNADIDKPGFIDNSAGANIRTGPAETGGKTLRATPLPPATRVFVSGTHPSAPAWWYVTAYLHDKTMVRGYVQGPRVNIELPEPFAELRQLVGGETAEGLAKEKFGGAVTDGHDLRYYENVLLHVNHGRAGINGTYQDPRILGGGSNNIQLVAGHRIWLVSAEYAKALQSVVPSGSLTGGAVAKVKRFAGHLQDILHSVTESRSQFDEVAGGFAQAIRDHLPEIIGITAGFLMAEATSMFLAAAPTGVTQAVAVVIQLALSAFGAAGLVQAGIEAMKHGTAWLTAAWTAHGKPEAIAVASKEFLRMLVAIAMAALNYLGAKGNYGSALKIARSMPTSGLPALATAVSGTAGRSGASAGVSIGPSTGAIGAAGNVMHRVDDEDPKDVVDYLSGNDTSRRPRFDGGEEQADHDHRDDVCYPEEYEDLAEQDGYQVAEVRDADSGSAARATDRPTWQESEQRVSHDLDWADFSDQRSFLDKKDVTRGTPGSTRPDSFSEQFRMSVDVKNYDISTSQGRSRFVERIVQQVTKRAPHLPNGTRQGVVIDAQGQAISETTLAKLRDQIVRQAGGLIDRDNIVFLTE